MPTFEKVLDKVLAANPAIDGQKIRRAYGYAEKLFDGAKHVSGDALIKHAVDVADMLLSFHPREDSVIAALLHNIPESQQYNSSEVAAMFGEDVAGLVSSLALLSKMKTEESKADAESLRKMFLAMARDVRVVMVKLADRLSVMKVLDSYPAGKRKPLARETLDIYVPIASRMGIYKVKTQMEDLCFKYLYSRQYEVLRGQMDEYKVRRGKTIDQIKTELKRYLDLHGIEAVVEGRIKNLYSIYKKLKLKTRTTLDEVYDVFAMRVVVPARADAAGNEQTDHLYAVLGLIHSKWKPVANRFKDYVAVPKPNGYQSLHTAVVGLSPHSSQATEIQIRTQRMHDEAEFGVASHWIYEDLKKKGSLIKGDDLHVSYMDAGDRVLGKYVGWLEALSSLPSDMGSGGELMETLKLDVFNDRIFVLTPTGEVKDLPAGATPVDFAYAIHTDLGHRCLLAKVNGSVVPLDSSLESGQAVEIITGTKYNPKLHWLSFVKTAGARTKIKAYFRGLDRERSFREGKEMINKLLVKSGKPPLDDELSLFREYGGKRLSLKDRAAVVEEVGSGAVLAPSVLKKVLGKAIPAGAAKPENLAESLRKIILPSAKKDAGTGSKGIYIAGETGLPHKFAQCCNPGKGQPIVAYVTRGHAVTIHGAGCRMLAMADQRRVVEAAWSREKDKRVFPVKLLLKMEDRVGLIRDIAETVADFNVNIVDFGHEILKDNRMLHREMVIEVSDQEQYLSIIERLQRIRNVLDVEKVD